MDRFERIVRWIGVLAILSCLVIWGKAFAHGDDLEWVPQGFPDYHSYYNKQWSCCGPLDLEKIDDSRWRQEGDEYVIDEIWRVPVGKAYLSERSYPVVAWKLGGGDARSQAQPNTPGKFYNGYPIEGVHCFFFTPGGA